MMRKMFVEKMLSQLTGDMYEFYQWLKSKCSDVVGVDVTYGKTHYDGREDVCMTFQLKYHWENELNKRKDSGIHKIITIMEYIAKKFNWDIDIKWFNSYRAATDDVLMIKVVNQKENLTTEVKSKMKKLNITKEAFEKSNYFKNKYGELEYVSESGKLFKTSRGRILMFKEGTESNPRFKCMEGRNEYSDEIREFRDDVVDALKKCYGDEYIVKHDMVDDKSILVSDPYTGLDYKIDISVSDEVEM